MITIAASWPRPTTQAPVPLRRRATDAPAPFEPGELDQVRREIAIELVLEAAREEDRGADPEVVEALRSKARAVLGGTREDRNMAPAPLARRRSSDGR